MQTTAKTNAADEVVANAIDRIGNRLLQVAIAAKPDSALRERAAMGAVRVGGFIHNPIADDEVGQARELIREINDVLEVASPDQRDGLRRTRIDLEQLIDRHQWQRENIASVEAAQRIRKRVAARKAALEMKAEG